MPWLAPPSLKEPNPSDKWNSFILRNRELFPTQIPFLPVFSSLLLMCYNVRVLSQEIAPLLVGIFLLALLPCFVQPPMLVHYPAYLRIASSLGHSPSSACSVPRLSPSEVQNLPPSKSDQFTAQRSSAPSNCLAIPSQLTATPPSVIWGRKI